MGIRRAGVEGLRCELFVAFLLYLWIVIERLRRSLLKGNRGLLVFVKADVCEMSLLMEGSL